MRILTLTILILLTATTTAKANVVYPDGSIDTNRFAKWVATSRVPLPPTINLHRAECPSLPGRSCSFPVVSRTTEGTTYSSVIYLSQADWNNPFAFYHEAGHLMDFQMDQSVRVRFATILHDGRAWREGGDLTPGHMGEASLSERWADMYARCAQWGDKTYEPRRLTIPGYAGFNVTPRQLRRACALIRSVQPVGQENYPSEDVLYNTPVVKV